MSPGELALLGAALFVMLTSKKQYPPAEAWGTGWLWPIPDLVDASTGGVLRAAISQEFRGASDPRPHLGIDLMYRDRVWFAPVGVPVVAARPGKVWSVTKTPRGFAVVLDHGPPWATFYQHLETLAPELAQLVDQPEHNVLEVTAGQQLGTMGADPLDPARVRHLHFAAWYRGAGDGHSVDPAPVMSGWGRWESPASITTPGQTVS